MGVRVIKSICGSGGGMDNPMVVNKYKRGSPQCQIIWVGRHLEKIGVPWVEYFYTSVGNGLQTSFWNDVWVGNSLLRNLFPRLFKLSKDGNESVSDRGCLGRDGVWEWHQDWSGPLRGRTLDEFQNITSLLEFFSFKQDSKDSWMWKLADDGIFEVKKLRVLIEKHCYGNEVVEELQATRWSKVVQKRSVSSYGELFKRNCLSEFCWIVEV